MSGARRKLTNDETAEYRADAGVRRRLTAEEASEGTGEPGQPGADPYAGGPAAHQPTDPVMRQGTGWDAAKSFANKAALGAGPQIAGALGALAHATVQPFDQNASDLDAYRYVRDETANDLKSSENTTAGQAVAPLAFLATPIPGKGLGRGASILDKAKAGAKVGAGIGGVTAVVNSKTDLTRPTPENVKRALVDALLGTTLGAAGGGVAGGALGVAEPALSNTAEEQALRAAGLRGGIKNSLKKDLGLSNMDEARELGRSFLDEGLIPPIGSSEAVGRRAEALQGRAGNAKSAVLNEADVSGAKFDYPAAADAARARLDGQSAVATDLSGDKAYRFADAFERQGAKTPGSFVGADQAKSDAWKSARFDDDAPMSAVLYRKGVGATRDDIERQVADALGAGKAATLRSANQKYGVGADALKLAENASTRDAAKKLVGPMDILPALSGGTIGGFAGHPTTGVLGGLATSMALKGFDKVGHSSAARLSDFLAERAAQNTGGSVGAAMSKQSDPLAVYLGLLEEPKK